MLEAIRSITPRYDLKEDLRFRGWMLDIVFKSGIEITIPAPLSVVFERMDFPPDMLIRVTRDWLQDKHRTNPRAAIEL